MSDSSKAPAADTPAEIRRGLVAVANATDTTPPGDGSQLPLVNLSQPISALARTVGSILRPKPIFRFGSTISTVDEAGEIAPMTADRMMSWVENYLAFTRPTKDSPAVESIGKDKAGAIMASDQFRSQLHELKGVSQVRLPTYTGEGDKRTVELAKEGFNPATGLFTLNRIPYAEDMDEKAAWNFLWHEGFKGFPFDLEGAEKKHKSRSFSVQIAAMLGVYCHSLFEEGTPAPMIVLNANQPGSGKSLLMRMILAPVHGAPAESGKPETEKDFESVLDSAAIARKPYLVLDDCRNLQSQALNRFVTSPVHECRLFHSQRLATIPKITQVLATGNGLTVSADLDRRALVVDLFEPGDATARTFKKPITTAWLFSDTTRSRFLAALWSIVRRWRDAGMPMMDEHVKPSFEDWTALIGGIVTCWEMTNPCTPRTSASGGDESTRALLIVIAALVGDAPLEMPPVLTTDDIIDRATADAQLEVITAAKEPKRAIGHKMSALKGRHLTDSQGRAFEFGKRDAAKGARYPITFLNPT